VTVATALRLNFACGPTRWPGFDNTDIVGDGIRHVDLEAPPYPYETGSADLILLSHALFMTKDGTSTPVHPFVRPIVEEFYRILRPAGWLRIDDNPWRCYTDRDMIDEYEMQVAYPLSLRLRRSLLIDLLYDVGFERVEELPTAETLIDADADTRQAILGNHAGHRSFTIEAQK
jgi:predicted SAM-dependent methyltransferase